jgi:hypothetical protein
MQYDGWMAESGSYYILPSSGMWRRAVSSKLPQSRRDVLGLSAHKNSTLTASPSEERHRRYIPQERWWIYISLDGVTLQPTITFATVGTSDILWHCKINNRISAAECWIRLCLEVACIYPQSVHINRVSVLYIAFGSLSSNLFRIHNSFVLVKFIVNLLH